MSTDFDMRSALTLLLAIALPTIAAGQSRSHDSRAQQQPPQRPFSALGPIGLPLPSITTTLPPIGLPLPRFEQPKINSSFKIRGLQPERRLQQSDSRDRRDRRGHGSRRNGGTTVVYVIPPVYIGGFYAPEPIGTVSSEPLPAPQAFVERVPTGWLQLELENAGLGAQLFIDGYFEGTFEDVNGQVSLEAGPHDVEIRSPGSKPMVFGVKVVADRTIRYRGAFEPLAGAAPTPPPPATSAVIYFIPGCYLGNVSPLQAALPAGCDIARLSTFKQ